VIIEEMDAGKGIVIHTIGIGSVSGGPIPLGGNRGYLKENGEVVISRMNPDILKDVAKAGGGKFLRAGSADPDLAKLLTEVSMMNKAKFGTQVITDYDDKFQYFLAAALLLIMIESVVSNKFNRLLRALNKFIEGKK
jgi:Ca-activated chloride channel family protein